MKTNFRISQMSPYERRTLGETRVPEIGNAKTEVKDAEIGWASIYTHIGWRIERITDGVFSLNVAYHSHVVNRLKERWDFSDKVPSPLGLLVDFLQKETVVNRLNTLFTKGQKGELQVALKGHKLCLYVVGTRRLVYIRTYLDPTQGFNKSEEYHTLGRIEL